RVSVQFWTDDETAAAEAARAVFDEFDRVDRLMTSWLDDSDVSKINRRAGAGGVKVSPEVIFVVTRALEIARKSGGAFDPTVGVLGRVWSFSGEKGRAIPSREEVEKLLELVDYRKVVVDRERGTVSLGRAGMEINLGGVAKGYIVGRAVEVLKGGGISRGIVKAGGDMVVFDRENNPFTIGIQHPRKSDTLIGEISFANVAIATSGDYERYTVRDGVRYHHILDPTTGFPARGSRGVTVLSRDPTLADALSTSVFVMGPTRGMALIEESPGVEGMIIDEEGEIIVSTGLKGRLVIRETEKPEKQ
ncbi:MAG: FAD:protein FMN transferase, partial [Thermodesulfobacteriota bacterium]